MNELSLAHPTAVATSNTNAGGRSIGLPGSEERQFGQEAIGILFASKLFLAIPAVRPGSIEAISLRDELGVRQTIRHFALAEHHGAASDSGPTSDWTVLVLPVIDMVALDLSRRLLIVIEGAAGPLLSVAVLATRISADGTAKPQIAAMLLSAAMTGAVDWRLVNLVSQQCRWVSADEAAPLRIIRACETPTGILIEGWIENLQVRNVVIATTDFSSIVPVEEMMIVPMAAPAGLATTIEPQASVTDMQGFSASLCRLGRHHAEIYLIEYRQGEIIVSGPWPLELQRVTGLGLDRLVEAIRDDYEISPAKVVGLLAPLVTTRRAPPTLTSSSHGPVGDAPRISVVVPLSGAEIFLQCLVAQQRSLPRLVEWVFTAERSVASRHFARFLASQQHLLRQPVKLVLADTLCGKAKLMNVGAESATAETLIFLDEATWIEDRRHWASAVRTVESRQFDVIGVGLRLDDGTIDHEGLLLVRSLGSPKLPTIEYRRRGLLARTAPARRVVETIEAVSSTAMVIGRGRFQAAGGFSEQFDDQGHGDVDLCVRVAELGGRVGFLPGAGGVRPLRQRVRDSGPLPGEALALLDIARLGLERPSAAVEGRLLR